MPAAALVLSVLLASSGYVCAEAASAQTATQAVRPNDTVGQPPRVRLIATGGTISNRAGGRLTSDELLASMPGIEQYARVEA